jgi:hypothetical protein
MLAPASSIERCVVTDLGASADGSRMGCSDWNDHENGGVTWKTANIVTFKIEGDASCSSLGGTIRTVFLSLLALYKLTVLDVGGE